MMYIVLDRSSDQSGRMEMKSGLSSTQNPNYSQFLLIEITNSQIGKCLKHIKLNAKYHGYLDLQVQMENMLLILLIDHSNLLIQLILMYRCTRSIWRI